MGRLPPPGKHRVSRSTSCALRQSQDNDIQAARVEEAGPEERKPEAKASSEAADQGATKNEAPLAVASAPRGVARSDAEAPAARRAFLPRQIAGRAIARPLSLVLSAREFLRTRVSRRPGS